MSGSPSCRTINSFLDQFGPYKGNADGGRTPLVNTVSVYWKQLNLPLYLFAFFRPTKHLPFSRMLQWEKRDA